MRVPVICFYEDFDVSEDPGDMPPSSGFMSFLISRRALGPRRLMHSMAATPGRYIEAALKRLCDPMLPADAPEAVAEWEEGIIVINPLAGGRNQRVGPILIDALRALPLAARKTLVRSLTVLTGPGQEFPFAYAFPARVLEARFSGARPDGMFRYLSGLDAAVDQELLAAWSGEPVRHAAVPGLRDEPEAKTGFRLKEGRGIFQSQAAYALRHLRKDPGAGAAASLAVMPCEAGDVLFAVMALSHLPGERAPRPPRGLAVFEQFAPIVYRADPVRPLMALASSVADGIRRGSSEQELFGRHVLPQLPADRAFHYLRPVRPHDECHFHLSDQLLFALGADPRSPDGLIARLRAVSGDWPRLRRRERGFPRRVFCHFEGGWALKHYPLRWREELVAGLTARGARVTVLGATMPGAAKSVPFTGLEALEAELGEQDCVVGVDSFPIHFASLLLGIPSIQLFGSTHERTCAMPHEARLATMSRGLGCSPCSNVDHCPEYHGRICLNFPRPAEILAAVAAGPGWFPQASRVGARALSSGSIHARTL